MSPVSAQDVALEVATPRDAPILSNLLELYSHDLSDVFALELDADGRFGYERLPLYWSEPERRFPFLIRCSGQIAGFALVTRDVPGSDDPDGFDVAEFFIVRRHRRSGVGRRAAFLLWNRLPGRWVVRVSEGNTGGCRFWECAINEFTGGTFARAARPGNLHAWRVFSFDSSAAAQ
jgi:predicted acetyltransferase